MDKYKIKQSKDSEKELRTNNLAYLSVQEVTQDEPKSLGHKTPFYTFRDH